jgi:hypothetical protein
MDNFLAFFLLVVFLGSIFGGGVYVGYRLRDNLSIQRQKKRYRESQVHQAAHAPASSSVVGRSEVAE